MHNMKMQLYKQRAVPNDTEHKSPGRIMVMPTEHKLQPQQSQSKQRLRPHNYTKQHMYTTHPHRRGRAQASADTGESQTCKSSKAATLANTHMWCHSAQSCETNKYSYSDWRNSAALWWRKYNPGKHYFMQPHGGTQDRADRHTALQHCHR